MNIKLIDLSIIIPTYNRREILHKTIRTIALQTYQPKEIIIVDASDEFYLIDEYFEHLQSKVVHLPAKVKGATNQRIQAFNISRYNTIGFMDDDVYLEQDCLSQLWACINHSEKTGGVNAIIVNQKYQKPGKLSSLFYGIMNGKKLENYAGKCIGPAINFLPDDADHLPNFMRVEWLNTTCTLYKKQALPYPLFKSHFYGYSLMEDLTLSLEVGENWNLYTVKHAKIFHDTKPSATKHSVKELAEMDLVNRYFIMKNILHNTSGTNTFHLTLQQLFSFMSFIKERKNWKSIPNFILGKISALRKLK